MVKPAIVRFLADVLKHREMILVLSAHDLQRRYAWTLGGMMGVFHLPFHADRLLVVYYLGCTITLLLGFGWLLSTLQVFERACPHKTLESSSF